MLRNNIELDVKVKCIEENKPQSKIAEEIGTSQRGVEFRRWANDVINKDHTEGEG